MRGVRGLVGVLVVLVVLVVLFVARSGREGVDDRSRAEAREASRAEARAPEIARTSSTPRRAPSEAEVEVEAVDDVDAGPGGASQLAAAHAMGAQADVSAFLERNAERAARHVDRFCEDSKKSPRPWPPGGERRRDAAEWMASRVDWITEPPIVGALHLDDRITERVASVADAWPDALGVGDLAGLDFTWMQALEAFDTWSLTGAGPIRDRGVGDVLDAPLPSYVQLVAWSKLHFVRALALGGGAAASREVRHLSTLLHGQGILIADVVAVKLLELEQQAFASAITHGRDVEGWAAPTDADYPALRRLLKAGPGFFLPGVAPEVMKKAAACATSPCSAVQEAAAFHTAIGAESPTNTSAELWTLAGAMPCDAALLETLKRANPMTPAAARAALLGGPSFLDLYGDR